MRARPPASMPRSRAVASRYSRVRNLSVASQKCTLFTTLGCTREHLVTMPSTHTRWQSKPDSSSRGTWWLPMEPGTRLYRLRALCCTFGLYEPFDRMNCRKDRGGREGIRRVLTKHQVRKKPGMRASSTRQASVRCARRRPRTRNSAATAFPQEKKTHTPKTILALPFPTSPNHLFVNGTGDKTPSRPPP